MDDKLFKAILAMDSYNRGYKEGINLETSTVVGAQIGDATILQQSNVGEDDPSVAAGFYAIAYTYGSETIISYRGTDENITPTAVDVINAYSVGVGNPFGAGDPANSQALMAFQFYRDVIDTSSDPFTTTNISVTGHSMGGGLAGLVAATYGKNAIIFDSMAFEAAAGSLYDESQIYGPSTHIDFLNTVGYSDFSGSVVPPNATGIESYAIDGEALTETVGADVDYTLKLAPNLGFVLDPLIFDIDPFDRHNVATMVIRMFAETKQRGQIKLKTNETIA